MKTKLFLLSTIVAVILSACKGDKGDLGPQGTTGANGTNGATGNTGPQGPGATSQTVILTSGDWTHIGTVGVSGDGYQTVQSFAIITASIVSTGTVLAYVSNNTTTWYAIPTSTPYSTWTRSWEYYYSLGSVTYTIQDSNFMTANPGAGYLKIVVIPGSIMHRNQDVDLYNYEQVKSAFNLHD